MIQEKATSIVDKVRTKEASFCCELHLRLSLAPALTSLFLPESLLTPYRLVGAVLVAEAEVGGLDEVEVGEDAVEEHVEGPPLRAALVGEELVLLEDDDRAHHREGPGLVPGIFPCGAKPLVRRVSQGVSKRSVYPK